MSKRGSDSGSETPEAKKMKPSSSVIGVTRSILACQRCRTKKIKCDQNFPKCSKCLKANVDCIGLDPATGREVPRSYIVHLEDRIAMLEMALKEKGIDPTGMKTDHELLKKLGDQEFTQSQEPDDEFKQEQTEQGILLNQVKFNTINSSDNRLEATSQSISFAKLMSTAVKFRTRRTNTSNTPEIELDPTTLNTSHDDVRPALLPPKRTAQEFIKVFFAQSNAQLPIFHREEFLKANFFPIYGKLDPDISLASNYTAINSDMFKDDPYCQDESKTWLFQYKREFNEKLRICKQNNYPIDPYKISWEINPPTQFLKPLYFLNTVFAIASSTHHLQYPLNISDSLRLASLRYIDQVYKSNDLLESLQGLLLMALYSIMRPTVPGCWYLVGSALRLCVDLGLHSESINQNLKIDGFTLDKRRRLFWCTYSLDRQISFYLSRPPGIPDEYITTIFPSDTDDALIVPGDQKVTDYSKFHSGMPSYKTIALSMFRIRRIQSEVQSVLFGNARLPRQFNNLLDWKNHITKLLKEWKSGCPKTRRKMNCDFNIDFFGLNYNHTVLILHGLSPRNFKLSKGDASKVTESSKELINIYTQLLSNKSINYTWAAVLNLFMAGTSYLYTIYNSEKVRSQNSLFEVKKITQECITVLNSLTDRCDAATTCKNTFEMLTAAIVKLRYNENVHGSFKFSLPAKLGLASLYSNNNFHNLVETLKTQEVDDTEKAVDNSNQFGSSGQQSQDYTPVTEPFVKLENDLNFDFFLSPGGSLSPDLPGNNFVNPVYQNNAPANADSVAQTPSTFEWTSSNPVYGDELTNFFDELDKSPVSTTSRRDSAGEEEINNQLQYLDANKNVDNNNTPFSYDSTSNKSSPVVLNNNQMPNTSDAVDPISRDSRFPSRDGRRVYEMIHQVPIDPIWDQFFTNNSNAFMTLNFDGNSQ